MNLTSRVAVLATMMTLMATALATPASADVAALGDSKVVALGGPHSCTLVGPKQYTCYGVDDYCLVYWNDDDANGNPNDANSTITQNYCLWFRTTGVISAA